MIQLSNKINDNRLKSILLQMKDTILTLKGESYPKFKLFKNTITSERYIKTLIFEGMPKEVYEVLSETVSQFLQSIVITVKTVKEVSVKDALQQIITLLNLLAYNSDYPINSHPLYD